MWCFLVCHLLDMLVAYLQVQISVSNMANLLMYTFLPAPREALLICLVPILRTVLSVCACRLTLNLRGVVDRVRTQNPPLENVSYASSQYSTAYQRYQARRARSDDVRHALGTGAATGDNTWDVRRSHLSDSATVRTPRPSSNAWEAIFGRNDTSTAELTAHGDQRNFSQTDYGDEITEFEVIQGYAS